MKNVFIEYTNYLYLYIMSYYFINVLYLIAKKDKKLNFGLNLKFLRYAHIYKSKI